ncbi:MAG: carboxyl transferase domain-containing protein, partial [Polymorphobacter sp.]
AAFGDGRVYLEALMSRARHIEVQLIGDRHGGLTHAGTRDCSLQRRHQKLIEIAPAHLPAGTETALLDAALRLGRAAHYDSLGTVEFLLDADDADNFAFIEMNPRLQVEHTVTEEITGIDLVAAQIRLAAGATLADLALPSGHRGVAVQARVNAETISADGALRAAHAAITRYEAPSGPGIRVDGFARTGTQPNPAFDSLLAKVIARGRDLPAALALLDRALGECVIDGPATNTGFLRALIAHPDIAGDRMTTSLVDAITADLVATLPVTKAAVAEAVPAQVIPEGLVGIPAPLSGLVVAVSVAVGDAVRIGEQVAVLEAMKMEHVVTAHLSGIVRRIDAAVGTVAHEARALVLVEPAEVEGGNAIVAEAPDPDHIRADLADLLARTAATRDAQRPDAVARRRKTGQRTARENIAELIDPGSFNEYGALTFAAQLKRHPREHLLKISPADGLIAGTASVNAEVFGADKSRVMVLSYDYTVFAGTQGTANHKKTDRVLNLARDWALPLIWYAEGGGGRPGDTDHFSATGLDVPSFRALAALSGKVLRLGIASGRCFAGNAVMFGLCDITIATRDSTIGLGGPAMIEGGGLGVFKPEEVGPIGVMAGNGVVDLVADDESHATALTKQLLGYFQGELAGEAADQRLLRHAIPENRLRVYDVRSVIETLFDSASVLELRRGWGIGMLTGFARLNGRAIGYLANDPKHLGGAIDSDGASKAAHFM